MGYTTIERSSRIYNTVADIFTYIKSSECLTPIELVRQQVDNVKPTDKVCIPGAGIGTYVMALIEKGVAPGNITAVELDSRYYELGSSMFERFGVNYVNADFLSWQPEMQFDVIVGNPPYNNEGKIKGSKQTSGTSLWLKFLKKIPTLLVDGGWSSLVLPAAVGNVNSQGWRSLRNCRIEGLETGVGKKFFKVGTEISVITFSKSEPEASHVVNGVLVNRDLLPILPAVCDPVSLSIFTKICSQPVSMGWNRDNWPVFEEKADGKCVVGMSFLDRSKVYNLQTFEDLNQRSLKKVNICWAETDFPVDLIRLMQSQLISFYAQQTMLSGNLSVGMVRAITFPKMWQNLKTNEEVFNAYGLTSEEVAYLVR
jgi:hypothetical protein